MVDELSGSRYEFYPVRLEGGHLPENLVIWCRALDLSDDLVLCDSDGFVRAGTMTDLLRLCRKHTGKDFVDDSVTTVRLDAFRLVQTEMTADDCSGVLDAWNFLNDFALSLDSSKQLPESGMLDVYERLCDGAFSPDDHSQFGQSEVAAIRKLLMTGCEQVRQQLGSRSQ